MCSRYSVLAVPLTILLSGISHAPSTTTPVEPPPGPDASLHEALSPAATIAKMSSDCCRFMIPPKSGLQSEAVKAAVAATRANRHRVRQRAAHFHEVGARFAAGLGECAHPIVHVETAAGTAAGTTTGTTTDRTAATARAARP